MLITILTILVLKNNAHVDFKAKSIDNVRFVKENSLPAIPEQLTAKYYVDQANLSSIDALSLVRNNHDNDFNNQNLANKNSTTFNTQTVNDNQVVTESYVDQFHQENGQSRREVGLRFYNQSSDLVKINQENSFIDKKSINLHSVIVNRSPSSDDQLTNKKIIDDSLSGDVLRLSLRFNQTLESYLKVSVGNESYSLTKFVEIQIRDKTEIHFSNIRSNLLQKLIFEKTESNGSQIGHFIESTKLNSQTSYSGARQACLPLEIQLCIKNQAKLIQVVKIFSFLLNEQFLFKILMSHSFPADFQFQLMIH